MGHDIIINGVPISEDALREMMAMLERQNTSDGDEPGSCIQSENFEWVIDDDGDIVIKRMWRCWRWIDVENVEEEETGKTLTAEEEAERWEELKKKMGRLGRIYGGTRSPHIMGAFRAAQPASDRGTTAEGAGDHGQHPR